MEVNVHEIVLDRYDLVLLDALQRDANATNAALGAVVNLSASQISRRLQRLNESGLIAGYAALLDPVAIGLGVTAFAHVLLERHGRTESAAFENAVAAIPEVLECHLMAGSADYLLKVVAQDTDDFARIHRQHLARLPGVAQMHSSFALRTVFRTTAIPV